MNARVRYAARAALQVLCGLTGHKPVAWPECPALTMCAWCKASTTYVTHQRRRGDQR